MNKSLIALAISGMMAGPAMAANEHDHGNAAAEDNADSHGMMTGMMDHGQMMQMQERMQEMQKLMADIHAESDPARRMQMMEEHMAKMHDAMGMMDHEGSGNMSGMDMNQRMALMQNQMGMMGMMMQQMMEHLSAEEDHDGNEPGSGCRQRELN
jgi:protein CpxP